MVVNPSDLDRFIIDELNPEKSNSPIYKLYNKVSLSAPILAAAKHELIFSITKEPTDFGGIRDEIVDKFFEHFHPQSGDIDILMNPNFITIFASPNAILFSVVREIGTFPYMIAADPYFYANLDADIAEMDYSNGLTYLQNHFDTEIQPDVSIGRIYGISSSDVSSYVARDLFFSVFDDSSNIFFVGNGGPEKRAFTIYEMLEWTPILDSIGYNVLIDVHIGDHYSDYDPVLWDNNHNLVLYRDHGDSPKAAIYSTDLPYLDNAIYFNEACLTCSKYDSRSFCARVIRNGGLAHIGGTGITCSSDIASKFLNRILYDKRALGTAFALSLDPIKDCIVPYILLGDPTISIDVPFDLTLPLDSYYMTGVTVTQDMID